MVKSGGFSKQSGGENRGYQLNNSWQIVDDFKE